MDLNGHIERILFTQQQISQRVSELGTQITGDFKSGAAAPVIVGVATGAFLFLADLVREIHLPITVDFVRAESYGSGIVSNGQPTISFGLKVDVRGKHVILVRILVSAILKFMLSLRDMEFGRIDCCLFSKLMLGNCSPSMKINKCVISFLCMLLVRCFDREGKIKLNAFLCVVSALQYICLCQKFILGHIFVNCESQ